MPHECAADALPMKRGVHVKPGNFGRMNSREAGNATLGVIDACDKGLAVEEAVNSSDLLHGQDDVPWHET